MNYLKFVFSGLLLFLFIGIKAQGDGKSSSFEYSCEVYEDLFGLDEALNLTLKFNIREFQKTRAEEEYHAAEMTCNANDTFQLTTPVRVKVRGIHRRDYCLMPPFWLNIRYSGIETDELMGIRRMKVVTRCRNGKSYAGYLLREYLVYKIFNLITPYSYRVRLINLKYVDTGRDNKETQDWAFLIEPDDMMAARLHARVIKEDMLAMRTVNPEVMNRLAMFQYMIGNGDYSVTGRHNLKILAMETSVPAGFVPVPYDFDYTGLVNAHYAVPNENLGTHTVRERYFLGPCRNRNCYDYVIRELEGLKDEIEALIRGFEYLEEEDRLDMIRYIESFFKSASDERFFEREISSTCT